MKARARQSEVSTNLKSLFTALRTQHRLPPRDIHSTGFAPDRGNRYSYHLQDDCPAFENRSAVNAVSNNPDQCVGADTFRYAGFPDVFPVVPMSAVTWDDGAVSNGLSTQSGIFGTPGTWDFMAYGAGDVDDEILDGADTWLIASADGELTPACPTTGGVAGRVAAGEPFNTNNDVNCR
ncbi:pilin [Hyalangium rubrum]